MALKATASATWVEHSDAISKNPYQQARNLSFKTNIIEVAGFIDLHFQKFVMGNTKYHFTPYLNGIINWSIENSFSIKRSLLNNNKIYIIKDNILIEKEINIIQIIEERAIIKGLDNGDEILSEPIKGSYSGMNIRIQNK